MEILKILDQWLIDAGHGAVTMSQPLSGGCINHVSSITTDTGATFCLKTNPRAPSDFFISEAENLNALAATNTVQVPIVIKVDSRYLLLEFIKPTTKAKNYWTGLAEQLAACHNIVQPSFGFTQNNYCGETPQLNQKMQNGYAFFGEHRLLTQAKWALDKGLLLSSHLRQIESIVAQLPNLIPAQKPALLHGDLWGGNLHCNENGMPVLIDPACYWGWPEADLAMTDLFGGFSDEFYSCYQECRQLEPGWRERFTLYNLYHLLNHLNLFGTSYLYQVENVLNYYC